MSKNWLETLHLRLLFCAVRVGWEVHCSDLRERPGDEGADDPGGHPGRDRPDQQPQQLPRQAAIRRSQHPTGQLQQGFQTEGGEGESSAWKHWSVFCSSNSHLSEPKNVLFLLDNSSKPKNISFTLIWNRKGSYLESWIQTMFVHSAW